MTAARRDFWPTQPATQWLDTSDQAVDFAEAPAPTPRVQTATDWPTVRTYPRTLDEAFPGTVEYADPIEPPSQAEREARFWDRVLLGLFVFTCIGMAAGWLA